MIVKPFNSVFFVMLILAVVFIACTYAILKNRTEKQKRIFLVVLCFINLVIFFVYKGFLSIDREFSELSGIDKFNWFGELPLHLCNINMFLIPIGIMTKKRSLMGFSFLLAPLGAIMAMIFPEDPFIGYSIAIPRIAGYYLTHVLVVICGVLMAVLGFYRPRVKDFPKITVAFFGIALLIHFINFVLRSTVCPHANYFFTYGSEISILKLFWKIIPLPFLYELPALLILFAYMGIICLLFYIVDKAEKKVKTQIENIKDFEKTEEQTEESSIEVLK